MGATKKDDVLDNDQQTDDQVLEDASGKQVADDEPVVLDTAKRFVDPSKPQEILTIDQIRLERGRAKQYDKAQSELHKTQEALKQKETEIAQWQQRAEMAEYNANLKAQEKRLARLENPDDDLGYGNDDADDQGIKPVERVVRQRIEPEIEKVNKAVADIDRRQKAIEQREQEQANREENKRRRDDAEKAKTLVLARQFPSLKPSEIIEIVRQERMAADAQGNALLSDDKETAYDLLAQAESYMDKASELRATARIKQEKENARQQKLRAVETQSTAGRKPFVVDQKPDVTIAGSAERERQTKANARKESEARQSARDTLE